MFKQVFKIRSVSVKIEENGELIMYLDSVFMLVRSTDQANLALRASHPYDISLCCGLMSRPLC